MSRSLSDGGEGGVGWRRGQGQVEGRAGSGGGEYSQG